MLGIILNKNLCHCLKFWRQICSKFLGLSVLLLVFQSVMLLVLSGFGSCTYNYASVAAAKHRFVAGADGGGGC